MICPIENEINKQKRAMDEAKARILSNKNIEANLVRIEKEYGKDSSKYPVSIRSWIASKHADKGRVDIKPRTALLDSQGNELNLLNMLVPTRDSNTKSIIDVFNKIASEFLANKKNSTFYKKLTGSENLRADLKETIAMMTPLIKNTKVRKVAIGFNADKNHGAGLKVIGNKAVVVDKDGNTIDGADANVLGILLGYTDAFGDTYSVDLASGNKTSGFGDVGDLIIRGALSSMMDLYKVQKMDPGYNNGQTFNNMWMLNSESSDTLRTEAILKMQYGAIPQSVAIKTIGQTIYASLPVKFSKNIDANAKELAEKNLGMIGMQWLSDIGALGISKQDGMKELSAETMPTVVLNMNDKRNAARSKINGLMFELTSNKTKKMHEMQANWNVNAMLEQKHIEIMAELLSDLGTEKAIHGYYSDAVEVDDAASHRNNKTKIGPKVVSTLNQLNAKAKSFNSYALELLDIYKKAKESGDENEMERVYTRVGLDFDQLNDPYVSNEEPGINVKEQISLSSKIISYRTEFEKAMEIIDEQKDDPFYNTHDFTVSQRFMVDATANAQSFKIVRNLVTSPDLETTMTLNENGEFDEKELNIFKLSIAQGLGIGIDKKLDTTGLEKISDILKIDKHGKIELNPKSEFSKHIHVLKFALGHPKTVYKTAEHKKAVDDAFKFINHNGEGPHAIQAIYGLMQLEKFTAENAKKAEAGEAIDKEFKHNATVESDAITSGMIISLIDIGSKDAILMAEKGGIYTKERIEHWLKVANAYGLKIPLDKNNQEKITHGLLVEIGEMTDAAISSGGEKLDALKSALAKYSLKIEDAIFHDFYNTIATKVNNKLNEQLKYLEGRKAAAKLKATGKTYDTSYVDLKDHERFTHDTEIAFIRSIGKFTRSMAKDPVMVYVYGSTIGSIKNKLVEISVEPMVYKIIRSVNYELSKHGLKFDKNEDPIIGVSRLINGQDDTNKSNREKGIKDREAAVSPDQRKMLKALLKSYGLETYVAYQEENRYGKDVDVYRYRMGETYETGYGDNKKTLPVVKPMYAYFNENTKRMETYKFEYNADGELKNKLPEGVVLTLDNLLINEAVMKTDFKDTVNNTIGAAFEDAFTEFKMIDEQRMKLKAVEMTRFLMFKATYNSMIRELIESKKHGDEIAEYVLSENDIEDVMNEILKLELDHSMPNIYKAKQPLGKSERLDGASSISSVANMGQLTNGESIYEEGDIENGLDSRSALRTSSISIKNMIANLGGAPVISTHSKDGYVDSVSALAFNLIRVYDGIVSGGNKIVPATEEYNVTMFDLFEYGTLDSQMVALNVSMKSLQAKHGANWKKVVLKELNGIEMENFIDNVTKIGINVTTNEDSKLEDISKFNDYGQDITNGLKDKQDNLNANSDNILIGHSYSLDAADQAHRKFNAKTNSTSGNNSEVMSLFYDALYMAKNHSMLNEIISTMDVRNDNEYKAVSTTIIEMFDKLREC